MFSMLKESKWIKITFLVLIAVFFMLNLYTALEYGNQNYLGDFQKFNNDDVKYVRSAWELADKGNFIYHKVDEPTVFIMPGLSFSIAFFVEIFGKFEGITAFRVFQAVLQTLSMYLIFLIGRKIFNSKVGLIACVINLLYISEYYATTIVLTEVLFKFLFLLLIYISILAVEEKRMGYYITGGVIWGLGCLVRPTIAAYPGVILIMWLIRKYSLKDIIKYTLVTTFVFSLIMSPWWIRNYRVFDEFIPLTLSTGNPFLQGTYINYDQNQNYTPYEIGKTVVETNQNEMNAGLYRLKTYVPQEPLRYLYWYTLGKSWHLWSAPFYWKEIMGISFVQAKLYHYIILITFILGTIRLFVKKQKSFMFLFLTIAFTNLIYLPYFTMSRYSYPLMPVVGIIAGFAINEALKWAKKTRLRRTLAPAE